MLAKRALGLTAAALSLSLLTACNATAIVKQEFDSGMKDIFSETVGVSVAKCMAEDLYSKLSRETLEHIVDKSKNPVRNEKDLRLISESATKCSQAK